MWLKRAEALWLGAAVACLAAFWGRAAEADSLPVAAVPVLAAAPAIDGSVGAAWTTAANERLTMDFTNRRPAGEATSILIAQDAGAIDVAFDVTQREPIVAATVTNGSSVTSDDYVEVALSPNGPLGFQYAFYANPRGARYQTSSENSAYAPPWEAAVKERPDGYTVTLRIPLGIIRSAGRTTWRAQFIRSTVRANALAVWAFDPRAASAGDATFFGTLTGIGAQASAATTRPRPRAQIYGLGELTPRDDGGNTSRIGADIALPVAPTASLVASFHPDYSNVETDQQTIAPTAFPRSFNEIRPFFTQAAQSFNATFSCNNCPQLLYTPIVPTFRDAYALEGTQGPLTYAAFDAVGNRRDDSAETLDYSASNQGRSLALAVQNVTVNEAPDFAGNAAGAIRDEVSSLSSGYLNVHSHLGAYLNYGTESGTQVSASKQATYYQTGAIYNTATTVGLISWEHLGAQFAPLDAYVAQNDISGPQAYGSETIPFKAKTILHDVAFTEFGADFKNAAGLPSQNDLVAQVDADFSNLVTVHAYQSESAVRTNRGEFLPFDGNGFLLGYNYSTATPTYVQYSGGPYYHGNLDSWTYLATLPLVRKVRATLETDRNAYFTRYPGEPGGTQWLERASLDFQFDRETQFDIGVRRVLGSPLPVSYATPNFAPINAGNVTAALHFLSRSGRSEIYLVYGDPNSLATTPALFFKYVFYLGAPKGT